MSELVEIPVASIVIGDRVRKNAGDITALAESIKTIGVLHPPVVTGDNRLVAGFRRLTACVALGHESIKVHRVSSLTDALDILTAERDENTCRLDPTPEEAVALAERLMEITRPKILENRRKATSLAAKVREARKRGEEAPSGQSPEGADKANAHESREIVAKAVGLSTATITRAKAVVEAAKSEPEKYGDLLAKMNETRKVNPAYDQLRERKETAVTETAKPEPAPRPATDPQIKPAFDSHALQRKRDNEFDRRRYNQFTTRFVEAVKVAEEELAKITYETEGYSTRLTNLLKRSAELRQSIIAERGRHRCGSCDGEGCDECHKCGWVFDPVK